MPHVIVEHSAGLDDAHDLQALCHALFAALAAHPAVPQPDTLKVRCLPCPHSVIGTEPQSFAHCTLRLLPGRDAATRSDLSATLLAVLDRHLPQVGSLSVDLADLDPAYAKRVL